MIEFIFKFIKLINNWLTKLVNNEAWSPDLVKPWHRCGLHGPVSHLMLLRLCCRCRLDFDITAFSTRLYLKCLYVEPLQDFQVCKWKDSYVVGSRAFSHFIFLLVYFVIYICYIQLQEKFLTDLKRLYLKIDSLKPWYKHLYNLIYPSDAYEEEVFISKLHCWSTYPDSSIPRSSSPPADSCFSPVLEVEGG